MEDACKFEYEILDSWKLEKFKTKSCFVDSFSLLSRRAAGEPLRRRYRPLNS